LFAPPWLELLLDEPPVLPLAPPTTPLDPPVLALLPPPAEPPCAELPPPFAPPVGAGVLALGAQAPAGINKSAASAA
jgi:hypothetical protein